MVVNITAAKRLGTSKHPWLRLKGEFCSDNRNGLNAEATVASADFSFTTPPNLSSAIPVFAGNAAKAFRRTFYALRCLYSA